MNKRPVIFLLFILIASIFTIGGCIDMGLKAPELKFAGIKVLGADAQGATLEIFIEAQNNNPIQLGIDKYQATLYINEKEVSTQSGGNIVLEPNEKKIFSVQGYFRFDNILGTTAEIFPDLLKGKLSLDYRVAGTVTARAAGLTFNSPISSSGKFNITIEPVFTR